MAEALAIVYLSGVANKALGEAGGEGLQVARLGQRRQQRLGIVDVHAPLPHPRAQVQVQTPAPAHNATLSQLRRILRTPPPLAWQLQVQGRCSTQMVVPGGQARLLLAILSK